MGALLAPAAQADGRSLHDRRIVRGTRRHVGEWQRRAARARAVACSPRRPRRADVRCAAGCRRARSRRFASRVAMARRFRREPDVIAAAAGVRDSNSGGIVRHFHQLSSRDAREAATRRMKQANAKVLIADDEQAITSGLSAILSDEGYTVEIAPDGQKALERLSEDRYGVVLADLKMPKLDGLALLRELQAEADPDRVHHHHRPGDGRLRRAGDAAGRVRLHREAAQRRQAQSSQGAHSEGDREVRGAAEEPRARRRSSRGSRTTASSPASPTRCARSIRSSTPSRRRRRAC